MVNSSYPLDISAQRMSELNNAQKRTFQTILEIDRTTSPAADLSLWPFGMMSTIISWWPDRLPDFRTILSNWSQLISARKGPSAMLEQMMELYTVLTTGRPRPQDSPDGLFGPFGNSIGLKQFRLSDNPKLACYKALANTRTNITNIHGMGMLGSLQSMMTSMDGGYSIRIHRFEAYPVVELLGLKISGTETRPVGKNSHRHVDILKPCLPYRVNMDFELIGHEPICNITDVRSREPAIPKSPVYPDFVLESSTPVEGAS